MAAIQEYRPGDGHSSNRSSSRYRYRLHIRSLPVARIWFFHPAGRLSSCMAVSGIDIPNADVQRYQKTRKQFWLAKLASNVRRDRSARRELKRMDWAILTVWQCELKEPDKLTKRLNDFLS
jgi:DNA mismatch endonuclease (patch repair protein)